MIVYEKGDLVFIFNFNTSKSFENRQIGTRWGEDLFTLFDTDSKDFSGQGRLDASYGRAFVPTKSPFMNRENSIRVYIPARTALVLIPRSVAV